MKLKGYIFETDGEIYAIPKDFSQKQHEELWKILRSGLINLRKNEIQGYLILKEDN